jgi:hypothetical protein
LALFFFLIKRTKNQVTRKASLRTDLRTIPPLAFALQIGQNHGLLNFAPLRSLIAYASAKSSYALPTLKATMFCPLSPEAYLLTDAASGRTIRYGKAKVNLTFFYSPSTPSAKSSYAPSGARGHHRSARFRPKLSC